MTHPHRAGGRRAPAAKLLILTCVAGCAGPPYEPAPLDAPRLLAEVREERRTAEAPRERLTESEAAGLLADRSPALRAAVAAWHVAMARVDESARRPNPTLGLGAVLGFGPDVVREVAPYGSLSLSFPLARLLARTDELAAARAERAQVEALALGRELRLELRARIAELGALEARADARRALVDALRSALALAHELVGAGAAGALDVSALELELARERAQLFEDRAASLEPRAALAALLDLPLERLDGVEAVLEQPRPAGSPALDALLARVDAEHPELLRLRLEHAIAERALALEVARARAPFSISAAGGRDSVDDVGTVQLVPTFTLPLFDRNQPAILEAERRRAEATDRFRGAAARTLAEVEACHRRLELATARTRMVEDLLLPAARGHQSLTHRAVDAGEAGRLDLITASRELRAAELARTSAALEEQRAWSALERAVGLPLTAPADAAADPSHPEADPHSDPDHGGQP